MIDIATLFEKNMQRVERMLEDEVGMMSPAEIKRRCRIITHVNDPKKEYFYCDDKLLFIVDKGEPGLLWNIIKPKETDLKK